MATDVISREAQREFPRWPIAAPKIVRVDLGPAGSGHIVDVSFGGIRIKSLAPLRRDAELPLRIEIPERSAAVQCSGVVVWSKPNGAAGLRFTRIAEDQKTILASWLSDLEHSASESSPQRDEFARITAQITAMKLNNADALRLIAQRVSHLVSASGVAIALGKPENMVCLARCGDAMELGCAVRPGVGLTGECLRGHKLVVCQDATTDPRAVDLKQGSALILPLLVNTELRGIMQVFSTQPNRFDARCIEIIDKLAGAAVFVTHNVMPQKRLAAVTPIPKPLTANTSTALKPSDSGKIKAFPPLPPRLQASTPAPAPARPNAVAETSLSVAPLAELIQPRAVATAIASRPSFGSAIADRSPVVPARYIPPAMSSVYRPPQRSSAKWAVVMPALVLLAAVPLGLYYWKQKPITAVAAAAEPAGNLVESSTLPGTSAPLVTPAVLSTSAPVHAHSAPVAMPEIRAAKPAKSAPVPEPLGREKKASLLEKQPPQPTPMMIASGVPVENLRRATPEMAAPAAVQLPIRTGAAMPGLNLPVTTDTPKLVVPVARTLTGGTLLQHAPPLYPRVALSAGIEGQVQLRAVVTSRGTVASIRRVSGQPILAEAAIDAVKRWRYEPFKLDGRPVDQELTITLNFKIPR